MADRTADCDFFGTHMRFAASSEDQLRGLVSLFGAFARQGTPPAGKVPFMVAVHTVDAASVPADLRLAWQGRLPEGTAASLHLGDDRMALAFGGCGVIEIDARLRRASVGIQAGGLKRFLGTPALFILDAALESDGQYMVHGACMVRASTGGAVLICAPSGTGKTTTAMALSRGGYAIVTDDASVLCFAEGRPLLWGLPRALKVHRRTAALLPWLGPLPGEWDENDEQPLALAALAAHAGVARNTPRPLDAVILLDPPNGAAHRIVHAPRSEVLFAMASDNVSWYANGLPARGARLFTALADAVSARGTYRLSAGPELDSLPQAVEAALSAGAA